MLGGYDGSRLLLTRPLPLLCSYFESGVCSVYLWDLDHGFAGVVLIKKAGDTEKIKGCWDSIHVVEVQVSWSASESPSRWSGVQSASVVYACTASCRWLD